LDRYWHSNWGGASQMPMSITQPRTSKRCGREFRFQIRTGNLGLRGLIIGWVGTSCDAVLACSALKQTYRQRLRINEQVKLVYLKGSGALLSQRLLDRKGHYMKEQMLESQLAILEEPEDAIVVDVSGTPEQMVCEIRRALELS
jgi:gluconokinase